ncbi:hypothetical protein [Pyxidicoccus caerfyrddinensis]|uniref:hypothetical protein n=1 Tax=Pyxidicoccus caerfyrddinensis TaxID=2709663 RepID=UPI0013DA5295|nr:hypothetical protein [Pyxidicoccus caerfyrddinensis]
MKRRAVAFTLLWLSLLAPGIVRAEGRAFDFSGASRSARLLDRQSPWARGQAGGDRIRALSHSGVTVTTSDEVIPTHLWVVPLVLTGVGFLGGVTWCALESAYGGDGSDCSGALLGGTVVGALLGLGYLYAAACAESEEGCSEECSEEDEDCIAEEAVKASRSRTALRDARRKLTQGAPQGLPLGLAPTVGFVNDRAVFGLGGHF